MSPDIFLDDFEITENTQAYHEILGRCLIIATRFDNLCDKSVKFLKIKKNAVVKFFCSEETFNQYVDDLMANFSTLNKNIKSLPIDDDIKSILHDARNARNEIAHSLTVGLTGCLDTKLNENEFVSKIEALISRVALGDYVISTILSILNKDPLLRMDSATYQYKIVAWVLDSAFE